MLFLKKDKSTVANKPPLSIIIVGAGKVGAALIDALCGEGNNVTLIDEDADMIEEMTGTYDIMGIVGNGASHNTQQAAGIDEANLLIAVTESDELNLLCCTIAQQAKDCATIARVRTPDYSVERGFLQSRLGLAMVINPELSAAREITRVLSIPAALNVSSFAHGQAQMIRVRLLAGSPIIGMTVAEYAKEHSDRMLFCAIERDETIHIASGHFLFREGDIVSFVCEHWASRLCLEHIGINAGGVKNCMIVGGGTGAYYLAKSLIANHIPVKIIEQNRQRCEVLSEALPDAIIINGDGTDETLLSEEGITDAEAFVPLTGIDEENIILSLHARQVSEAKVVTKLDRVSFNNVVRSLDLGSVVLPRFLTSEAILAYARARRASIDSNKVVTLTQMYDRQVECIEFAVDEASEATGIPLKNLKLKMELIISFISRGDKVFFPLGDDEIHVGDTVMVVTKHKGFSDITDILA